MSCWLSCAVPVCRLPPKGGQSCPAKHRESSSNRGGFVAVEPRRNPASAQSVIVGFGPRTDALLSLVVVAASASDHGSLLSLPEASQAMAQSPTVVAGSLMLSPFCSGLTLYRRATGLTVAAFVPVWSPYFLTLLTSSIFSSAFVSIVRDIQNPTVQ